jgi:cell division protein FtsX
MRWLLYVAVVVGAFVSGAVAATAVTLLAVDEGPRERYIVTVFLKDEVTTAEKTALQSALSRLYPTERVQLESREQTAERFREQYGNTFLGTGDPVYVESFRVEIGGPSIDCAALAPVKEMAGARFLTVVQPPAEGNPHTLVLECP